MMRRTARIATTLFLGATTAWYGACATGGDDAAACDGPCGDGASGPEAEAGDEAGAETPPDDTGDADGTSVDDGDGTDTGSCVPTEAPEVTCNRIDDDCNGIIDDVDLGGDGICDCLGILLLGDPGPNPGAAFVAWLTARGTTATRRVDTAGGPLTAADLVGIDVVVLDRLSRDYEASEVAVLHAFLGAGGGLISMTGYDWRGPDATRPNGILAGLGAVYDAGVHIDGPLTDPLAVHPISEGIDTMTFHGGYPVTALDGFATAVVARVGGTSVGVAVELGDGRVFVWGDEWIEYDSEWAAMPAVARLWANLLGWLVPRRCNVPIF
ncbi:MAG: hypothetical protein JXB32_21925 [Deltaproteobacteria bacterium]|nr:hypothetical protein [Deltaproteobacteria bacterium]